MSGAASVVSAILPVAAELLPKLYEALAAGNKREAKQVAEEIARRQAFELLQVKKSKALKKLEGLSMSGAASVVSAILPVAAELLPKLDEALAAGNKREAKQVAEEIARRQAFELLQVAKSKALKKK